MIGHKRIPSREGGVEVVVGELATRMAALGHDVTCYSRSGHSVAGAEYDTAANTTRPYEYRGVHVVPVPTIDAKGLAALSSSFFATLRAMRSHPAPDVIHYHAEGPCVPLRLAHMRGIRTVATIHGLDWQRAKWGKLASAYIKFGERTAVRSADEMIVLSEPTRDYFMREYGRATHFIPNGIDLKAKIPAEEITRRWGLTSGSYVLFLGRIVPEKGLGYLLNAWRQLETDKTLVIAGGASDSAEFHGEVRARAERIDNVKLTGFVQGRVLEELYSNAYAYVLPSDVEGMPLSLLEAMSYGCPCITSDIPECADVLAGSGLVFPRASADGLRDALATALADPASVRELGERARCRVRDMYDWDDSVERTLALYRGEGR